MYQRLSFSHPSGASFSLTPFGGHLLSYSPPSSPSILWLSSSHITDTTKSIRGGVPVCFPQFGRVHDKVSPQHGWARLQTWRVVTKSDSGIVLQISSKDATGAGRDGLWPAEGCAFETTLTLEVSLDDDGKLVYVATVKNDGDATMPYQLLLHNYYSVDAQSDAFGVTGLEGMNVIDTQPRGREGSGQTFYTQSAVPITVEGEVDRIFHGQESELVIGIEPGAGRARINVKVSASNDRPVSCVVWNPYVEKAKEMGDFDDEGWKQMICVEPGLIDGLQIMKAGEEQTITQTIWID